MTKRAKMLSAVECRNKYGATLQQALTILKKHNNSVERLHKKDHCKSILACCYSDYSHEGAITKLPELRALVQAAILHEPDKLKVENMQPLDQENVNS